MVKGTATRWASRARGIPGRAERAPRGARARGGGGWRGEDIRSAPLGRPPRRLFSPAHPPVSAARGAAGRPLRLWRTPSWARGATRSCKLPAEKPYLQSKTTEKCAPPPLYHPQFQKSGNHQTSSCRAKTRRLRRGLSIKRRGHPSE